MERKKQTSIETNIMEHLFLVDNKLGICHTTYQGLLARFGHSSIRFHFIQNLVREANAYEVVWLLIVVVI